MEAKIAQNGLSVNSTLEKGCLETGKDVTAGGAVYNFTGVQGVGVADVADSLTAIDQLVFREKLITMDELLQALEDNSMTTHQGFGKFVGALPSGRKAFEAFANGISPCTGLDRKGLTATLKSGAKINYSLATNGVAFNLKLNPSYMKDDEGTRNLSSLIRAYFRLGGMHLQINVIDRQTLLDAQQNPQKYPGLMVRVAGYSAYFADLTKEVQDEIISRTEHGIV